MDMKEIMATINDNPHAGIRVLDPKTMEGGFVDRFYLRESTRIYMNVDSFTDVECKKYEELTEMWAEIGDIETPTHIVVMIENEAHMIVDAIAIAGYVTLIAEY